MWSILYHFFLCLERHGALHLGEFLHSDGCAVSVGLHTCISSMKACCHVGDMENTALHNTFLIRTPLDGVHVQSRLE